MFLAVLIAGSATAVAQDVQGPEVDSRYLHSVNQFGLTLLDKLSSKDSTRNVFISPAGLLFALAMADNGAEGSTDEAMRSAMGIGDVTTAAMNASNVRLLHSLTQPDTSVELSIANSLWINDNFTLKSEFMRVCEEEYKGGAYRRNFSSEATVEELNGWVKEKTNGKIARILDELEPADILVILDAVYFHGRWTHEFKAAETKEKPFYFLGGPEKDYPRMAQTETYPYFENRQYQAVSIPYGKRYNMVVYLPRERAGLPELIREFGREGSWDLTTGLVPRPGRIEVPRFRVDYGVSLVEALTELGMGIAFGRDANFSRLTDAAAHINEVVHKAFIEVNEKGTVAAAVTAILGAESAAVMPQTPPPFMMIIDHPFLCLITDNLTGLILFSGAILDPAPGSS